MQSNIPRNLSRVFTSKLSRGEIRLLRSTRSFANGIYNANAKYSTAAAQSVPSGPQAAQSQGPMLQAGGDAMEAITKLSPELARELNKGYKIPDLVRLVRTKHPEANDIIKIMIMFMIADKRTIVEIESADGINVMSEVIQASGDNEDIRLNAVRLLGGMATDDTIRKKIAETDTVQRVAKHLLNAISDEAILTLLMALRNFAAAPRAAQEINEIPSMHRRISELLSKRFNEAINENAAGLVTNLAREHDQKLALARAGVVGSLGQLLDSQNVEVLRVVTQALRNLGHNDKVQLHRFEEANIVGPMVGVLKRAENPEIQENIAFVLEFLALKFKNRVMIRDAGGIPVLIETLRSRLHRANKLPFLAAIRNICDENDVNKVSTRESGGIDVLVSVIKDRAENTLQENIAAIGGLHNLASEVRNRALMHRLGMVTALYDILDEAQNDPQLIFIAVRTLHRLCVDEGVQYDLARRNRLDTLIELIQNSSSAERIKEASAATVLALVQGKYSDEVRDILRESTAINVLMMIVGHSENIRLKDLANSIMFSLSPSSERKP